MNKAFKVIWNHATQSWTAVSEIARSKGKTKSVKTAKTALAAAVAVAAATAGTSAHAAMAVGGTAATAGTTNNGGVTVVNGGAATAGTATVTGSAKGMAIGQGASVSFDHTNAGLIATASGIAMGNNATVNDANRAVVIGGEALASGANAVVIGTNATAIKSENTSANGLVVIGNDALIRNVNIINNQNGQSRGSTAIGANSLAGLLTEKEAAIGAPVSLTDADYNTQTGSFTPGRLMYRAGITDETGATVGGLQANEATAIGFDARAIGDQSIAIGAQTVAGHSSVAIGGNDMAVANSTTNAKIYKDIVGVDLAANRLPSGWYETTYAKDGSVAIGQKAHSNEVFGTAIGTSAFVQAGAELGTAIGTGARVGAQTETQDANMTATADFTTKGGVAIAAGAVAERDYTTAIGTGSKANQTSATAMGYQALASGVNATAVGAKAIAAAADALAYGGNATAYATNSVAVGTNSTVVAGADSSIAFGTDTSVSGVKTVALGSNIKNVSTSGSVVLGDSSSGVVGTTGASHAVGTVPDAVVKSANGAEITYGGFAGQPLDAGKYVSIGAPRAERQLKNVAAGNIAANSTDGINGSQLYSVAANLGTQVFQSTYFHVNNITNAGTGNSTTNLGNITDAAGATGQYAVTAGVNSTAISNSTIALGHGANAGISRPGVTGEMPTGDNAIAIGTNADAQSADTIAIGRNARVLFTETDKNVFAVPLKSIAIGADSKSQSEYSTAIGFEAIAGDDYHQSNATSVGARAKAVNINTLAVGSNANASGTGSSALGVYSEASGNRATAVGFQSQATGDFGVALGAQSDAAYLATATGTGAQATAEGATANGYRTQATGVNSLASARGAQATATNATALGRLAVASHENAVALGSGSTTTTANPTTEGTVANITYGTFAGVDPTSVVSVGSVGAERQIVNVAAGRISATSTDAINGSQLYFVAEQAAKPLTITANTNADTDAELLEKQYAAGDGTQQQLGETLAIIGSKTNKALTENTDAAVDSTYSAKNIQTVVTDNQVQIQMAEKPEFKEIKVKADDNDSNPVVISSGAGDTGGKITNIEGNLPGAKTGDTAPTTEQAAPTNIDAIKNNAATVGDVLNAGWNLQTSDTALDFVTPYDTVNFVNGNATTVVGEMKNGVATIKYDVAVDGTTIEIKDGKLTAIIPAPETTDLNVSTGPTTANNDTPTGKVETPTAENATKLVNVGDIAEAINASGFTLKSSATDGTKDAASTGDEIINPGDVIEMVAGKNMTVKQEANGKITYSTEDSVEFTNVNVTSSLPTTSVNVGEKGAKAPTNLLNLTTAVTDTPDAVVTAKDLANYGWVVATPDNGYDAAVKSANTVNFIGDNHISVTGANNATTGAYDVKIELADTGAISFVEDTTGTAPTNTGAVKAGDKDGNNPTGFVSAKTVADAINGSGWRTNSTTATGTATETLVNPGEQVNFEAGKNMVVTQKVDTVNGVDTISYTYATADDVNFNSTTIGGTPTYTDADGNKLTKNPDGTYTDAAGNIVDPADVTTVINNPITIGTVDGKNVISNLNTTLPSTTSVGDAPTTTAPNKADGTPFTAQDAQDLVKTAGNNAATLGDVLNAGWNLKVNNEDVDFVKPYDTVAFVNGTGTTARVDSANGTQSNVTFDINVDNKTTEITYADAAGNTVKKVGDKFYNPSDLNEDGTLKADAKPVENVVSRISAIGPKVNGENVTGPANLVNGDTTTVTNTPNGIKVEVNTGTSSATDTGLATPYTDKDGNPVTKNADGTYTDAAGNPIAAGDVIDGSNQVATVGDIVNTINGTGWNLQENGKHKDLVTASNVVNFVDGAGTTANITTNPDGTISNVTYNVNVDNSTTMITYAATDADGKPITAYLQPDGTYNTQKDGKGTTVAADKITGSQITAIAPTTQVNGDDVTGPVNLVNGNTTTVTNTPDGIKVEVNTTPLTNADNGKVNAPAKPDAIATAGDVAKAINGSGFTLTAQGANGSLVSPGETVDMKNTDGNINITKSADNNDVIYNLSDDVKVSNSITAPNVNATTVNVGGAVNGAPNTALTTVAGTSLASDGKTAVATDTDPNTGNGTGYALSVGGNQITNVANGAISPSSTDAINGSQLYALQDVFNQQIGGINNRIDDLEDESRAGIAGSAAMINIPQVTRPGANLLGVGLGHHKGESAVAVGFSSASDNERLIFKMSGSANTQGDFTIGTGMGWQW